MPGTPIPVPAGPPTPPRNEGQLQRAAPIQLAQCSGREGTRLEKFKLVFPAQPLCILLCLVVIIVGKVFMSVISLRVQQRGTAALGFPQLFQ
jgi:hypothetical protein